jgi:hypothetical protein
VALVNAPSRRYPARMETLTIDTLRTLAAQQGLALTDEELATLLPIVKANRSMLDALRDVPLRDVEPAVQYRIV